METKYISEMIDARIKYLARAESEELVEIDKLRTGTLERDAKWSLIKELAMRRNELQLLQKEVMGKTVNEEHPTNNNAKDYIIETYGQNWTEKYYQWDAPDVIEAMENYAKQKLQKPNKMITVNGFNNFCRVFQLPAEYPEGYCFGGGLPTTFIMVDWFCPVPDLGQWAITEKQYRELKIVDDGTHSKEVQCDELQKSLTEFLTKKNYIKEENTYLVICNFGMCFTFMKSVC